ncbi:hypothetical protein [Dokdonella soli]|uniref:Uncharacterized protein n=1 Tax=Dokdonella soli TaxID=529810 RepID=A0ABN1IZR9_9GAMM
MAESVGDDLVGHDALMPSMSKMEDTFRASNRFEQGCISHCLLLAERHYALHGCLGITFDMSGSRRRYRP